MKNQLLEPKWDCLGLTLRGTGSILAKVSELAEFKCRQPVGLTAGQASMNHLRWVISDAVNQHLIGLKDTYPWLKGYRG